MRVRALDSSGDMTFGQSLVNYLANSPAAVAQCIQTRLGLIRGEWFLDKTEGTDWGGKILGRHAQGSYDGEIRRVISGTTGVAQITGYASSLVDRKLTVSVSVLTDYSTQPFALTAVFGRSSQALAPVTGFPTGSSPTLALLDFTFVLDQSILG